MIVLMVSILSFVGGCTAVRLAKGIPGLDISSVKPGALRNDIETHIGTPMRTWTTSRGVTYHLYRYDAGIEGSPSDAVVYAIMDLGTLGLWEIPYLFDPNWALLPAVRQQYHLMAVSYDANDRAIGVFPNIGEFVILPEDGRAAPPGGTTAAPR